jgi:hypothetical protein
LIQTGFLRRQPALMSACGLLRQSSVIGGRRLRGVRGCCSRAVSPITDRGIA